MVSVAIVSKMHFSSKIKFQQAPNEMYNWLVAVQCSAGCCVGRAPVHIIRLMHWSRPAAFTVFISWETLAIKTFRQSLKVIFTADRLHINYSEL